MVCRTGGGLQPLRICVGGHADQPGSPTLSLRCPHPTPHPRTSPPASGFRQGWTGPHNTAWQDGEGRRCRWCGGCPWRQIIPQPLSMKRRSGSAPITARAPTRATGIPTRSARGTASLRSARRLSSPTSRRQSPTAPPAAPPPRPPPRSWPFSPPLGNVTSSVRAMSPGPQPRPELHSGESRPRSPLPFLRRFPSGRSRISPSPTRGCVRPSLLNKSCSSSSPSSPGRGRGAHARKRRKVAAPSRRGGKLY